MICTAITVYRTSQLGHHLILRDGNDLNVECPFSILPRKSLSLLLEHARLVVLCMVDSKIFRARPERRIRVFNSPAVRAALIAGESKRIQSPYPTTYTANTSLPGRY